MQQEKVISKVVYWMDGILLGGTLRITHESARTYFQWGPLLYVICTALSEFIIAA